MSWSPSQYTKFENERNRPVLDLLAQIPNTAVATAVDIGCGPGNSTELLQAHFPEAVVSGMDSSPDMIEAARKRLPAIEFEIADISSWSNPAPFDVIFSNAALQWVPDHKSLLPTLISKLAPGGSLAVQIPDNLAEPSHRLMREVAEGGSWAKTLKGAADSHANRHSAGWYYRELKACGTSVNVWRTTFYHPLAGGPNAIVEWFKSTGLRPFLAPLNIEEQTEFLARYEAAIGQAYPILDDGSVLLPFPRLFFVATYQG